MMKTIVMAGGNGTRIQSVASDVPKPMIRINGKPVLEIEIENLKQQGFTDFIITVSHLGNVIMDYFGNGNKISPVTGKPFGVNIVYYNEKTPLGNAGALFKLRNQLGNEPFLLLNGDVVFDVDFNRMMAFHNSHNALVTLFTHPNSHPYDSGVLITESDLSVKEWLAKEDAHPQFYKNRVNAGLHIINPKVLDNANIDADIIGTVDSRINKIVTVDLDRHLLKPLAGTHTMFCYDSPEYVKDMGTPKRFHIVEEDFKKKIIQSKNLSNKQKAIFLDRDGTINEYIGFLKNIEDFKLIDGISSAIEHINMSGYLCIVITNQPVIARGELTYGQLTQIHNKMETLLGMEGAYIDGLYFCPHHPDKGYEGEIPELKIDCNCRKPKPGMLIKAAGDFNISLEDSYMLGDSKNDIYAGIAAGCKTILITNKKYNDKIENWGQTDTLGSVLEFVEKYL